MLAVAAYTANLASIMTTKASRGHTIADMDDLVKRGGTVCVLEATAYGGWLKHDSRWSRDLVGRVIEKSSVDIDAALRDGVCDGLVEVGVKTDDP